MWKRLWKEESGMAEMVSLLIVMGVFLFVSMGMVSFMTFMMRQEKLETIHHRALEMSTQEGYITPSIMEDTRLKLQALGFPSVQRNGVDYPSFEGSTLIKVQRDDADPTVQVTIKYPATLLQRMVGLIGGNATEEEGYYLIEGAGRSEALDD
ncbi:hypothetical protein SY83_12995 [Paenibacillus swuensis]|uniref:Uncharacterized protein n=1 Tax=Paenibacillus swuensis TaxID=1178515 RepID=A0A172TJS1_9BACL|nr:hypothetical protein [Paenibacillus swuensis]ANE47033.1 hypothetical protein SY83_12995 [Paenibacillus swuensis]